jgi:hypothetical protein
MKTNSQPKSPTVPKITEDENDKNIAVLLKRLDIERHAKGELVMYPGTDMRWYAITVAVAGLLNREREIARIEAVLLEAEIRPEGDIVAAVKRLADRRYEP